MLNIITARRTAGSRLISVRYITSTLPRMSVLSHYFSLIIFFYPVSLHSALNLTSFISNEMRPPLLPVSASLSAPSKPPSLGKGLGKQVIKSKLMVSYM